MNIVETVLFLCSGNYYRSRFAEHYFNDLAARADLAWRAQSRGLQIYHDNIGPMSSEAQRWLTMRGVRLPEPLRYPLACTEDDLRSASIVVAVKEAEHRPLLEQCFPACIERVEFWHVHDLDVAPAAEAIPELAAKVEALVLRLSG